VIGLADIVFHGRRIVKGKAEGEALVTKDCISFMGSTNPKTGCIIEHGHELEGQCMQGKIFCFPSTKGSTGGSYMLYDAVKRGVGPAGIVNIEAESIAVIGAIVADLPMVDKINITQIETGDYIFLDADNGTVTVRKKQDGSIAPKGDDD
jgi:predicted aconitase with swiveling domain